MRIQWPKCRWPWPLVKVKGQGQIFPKMGKIPKNWSYLKRLFHLQTSYLVPSYNPIRCIQWPKCRWPLPKWIKNQRTVHFSEAISHDIYYHSFLWLIWALPSCLTIITNKNRELISLLVLLLNIFSTRHQTANEIPIKFIVNENIFINNEGKEKVQFNEPSSVKD